mmetsp:Transcript_38326/g.110167  ORF Transcript_38326/g.110167 Transcript_38326/m.110167 type:complete len:204 (-) Transcript_38326:241-852(-)
MMVNLPSSSRGATGLVGPEEQLPADRIRVSSAGSESSHSSILACSRMASTCSRVAICPLMVPIFQPLRTRFASDSLRGPLKGTRFSTSRVPGFSCTCCLKRSALLYFSSCKRKNANSCASSSSSCDGFSNMSGLRDVKDTDAADSTSASLPWGDESPAMGWTPMKRPSRKARKRNDVPDFKGSPHSLSSMGSTTTFWSEASSA